jgi:hypothetical protein
MQALTSTGKASMVRRDVISSALKYCVRSNLDYSLRVVSKALLTLGWDLTGLAQQESVVRSCDD